MSDSLWPHGWQHASLSFPSLSPKVCSNSCPLSRTWILSNHLILCCPLLLLPSIFPSIRVFPMSRLFTSDGQSIGASASASVIPLNIQVDFLSDWLIWSHCCPRDSQESTQFKSINSLALSLLYGPTPTYIPLLYASNLSRTPSTLLFAGKSLQSCPTLCDHIDGSPPGSPVPGILQARTLEWVAISFSNSWKWKVKVKTFSRARLLATPWTAAYQAPLSMGFSRQEYWSRVPLPSPTLLFSVLWMCNIFSHLWVLLDGDTSVWNALLTPFSVYQHFIESTWFKYSLSSNFSWLSSQN